MVKQSSGSSRSVMQPELSESDIARILDEYADMLGRIAREEIPDEEIDTSDIPEWTEEQFSQATVGRHFRPRKGQLTLRLDTDVIAWFREHYPKYQTAMNAALRSYMNDHHDDPDDEEPARKVA